MKKLLYTLLAVTIMFSACEKEEDSINNGIADVVGVWKLTGFYNASGNLEPFYNSSLETCQLQSSITLQSDGSAIITWYYLENEISGSCVSEINTFQFNYINSTTLEFIVPSQCGNATIAISPTVLKWYDCNADNQSYDLDYRLFEKQ